MAAEDIPVSELVIDINADLGESEEALANGTDFELMRYITSANVACGGHAGTEETMRQTLVAARQLGVAAGAHPGYPDRANFGRVESALSPAEIEASVLEQIASLAKVAESLGMRLVHVKPHGALYHAANKNREVALAIGRAAKKVNPAARHGRAGWLSGSGSMAFHGAAMGRRGLCGPRLRAGRNASQTHSSRCAAR